MIPTFRLVKSLATVPTVGVPPFYNFRTVLSVHPTGTTVTTPLGTVSKKISPPGGHMSFPTTEPLSHYSLKADVAPCHVPGKVTSPAKCVGMTTPSPIAPTRPTSLHNPIPYLADMENSTSVSSGCSPVRTPILSGPGNRKVIAVVSIGSVVKEIAAVIPGTSHNNFDVIEIMYLSRASS